MGRDLESSYGTWQRRCGLALLVLVTATRAGFAADPDSSSARGTTVDSAAVERALQSLERGVTADSVRIARAKAHMQEMLAKRNEGGSRRGRFGFTGGSEGQGFGTAVGLLASPSWFVLMKEDEEKWMGGSNLVLACIGFIPNDRRMKLVLPVSARVAYLSGMSGLAAWELSEGEKWSDGRLLWTNLAGITATVLITDLLTPKVP